MRARPVLHDYREPGFVWDGAILPPRRDLAGLVQGLVRNSFVGSIVASFHLYRLPEAIPWLLVARGARRLRVLVIGPRTHVELESIPPWTTSMCAVVLRPGAMGAVLGIPAVELADACCDLEDVLGPAGRDLRLRLEDAGTTDEQLVLLEEATLGRAGARGVVAEPTTVQLANALARRPVLRVDALERMAGWSQRHLRRQLERDLGLSPKRYLRLLRFSTVMERLREGRRQGQQPAWRDLALGAGYADQAHLITEFRGFTGLSPAAFLAHPIAASALRHGAVPLPRLGR